MEHFGLSSRGAANVEAIWPRISKAVADREQKEEVPCIDMGTSENWLIRKELIAHYKEAIRAGLSDRHMSYPNGFNGDQDLLEALMNFFNAYFKPVIPARSSVRPVYVSLDSLDDVFGPKVPQLLDDAFRESPVPIRALLFTNPHNPLGQCYPETVMMDIIKFCDSHKVHFISDEIYAMSAFSEPEEPSPTAFVSALQLDIQSMGCDLSRVHTVWSIISNTQMSSLTAIATTSILSSPELPKLFALNSERLSQAYRTVTSVLKRHNILYVQANIGPFILVRLLSDAQTWEEEAEVVQACRLAGVVISGGRSFHVPENEKGWARLNFAIPPDKLDEGIRRVILGREAYLKRAAGLNGNEIVAVEESHG
ncbi:hypothetical protein SLS64_010323 [Diaporthe eres]